VLDGLKNAGLDDETLVVYFGDHGYLLNHHKRFEKHMMWEEAVSAPLIIRRGNDPPVIASRDELVEFVDIVPTITDFLDVPSLDGAQGKSLRPFFSQDNVKHKDYVFSEFLADNKAMIRTNKWKYIFTSGKRDLQQGYETGNPPTGIRHRLYDQINDPKETTDVSERPENQKILQELKEKMVTHFKITHPETGSLPEGLSIDEQLEWFCEPPEGDANIEGK
jgi:arylsulfatase A-like enzyme